MWDSNLRLPKEVDLENLQATMTLLPCILWIRSLAFSPRSNAGVQYLFIYLFDFDFNRTEGENVEEMATDRTMCLRLLPVGMPLHSEKQ